MHAALDINIPNYASAIVTTNEIVDSMQLLRDNVRSNSSNLDLCCGA